MDYKEPGKVRYLLSRRDFIRVAAAGTGAVLLAACGGNTRQANSGATKATGDKQSTPQPGTKSPSTKAPRATRVAGGTGSSTRTVPATEGTTGEVTAAPASFKEAPSLAQQAQSGKLPKVAERLPTNPLVLKPVERTGKYGGEWRTALIREAAANAWLTYTIGYENLVRWQVDIKSFSVNEVIPNVAESFEFNKEGTEYTFKLRKGMKWSDGKPFTADDIMFWYEDILMNKELSPAVPKWLTTDEKPVIVQKVDDQTVVFRFAKPNGLFLQNLASTGTGAAPTYYPRHYLQQFHKKYNPKVGQQAKQAQMQGWTDLFLQKASPWDNTELPVLHGWILTTAANEDAQRVIAERNPYYWKVDTDGNQLPYLDRVNYTVVRTDDVLVLKALNGEIDFHFPNIDSLENKPLFYKNREKGDFHVTDITRTSMNPTIISLNLTHKDSAKRKVFQNKDFRIGLSYAINRQEIIDAVWVSQGEPFQAAPRPDSPFYNEKLAKQYTEYDVKKANEYLDKVMPKKDAQGFRLGPDGKRFSFLIEVITPHNESIDSLGLMQGYWKKVGVDMQYKAISRELFSLHLEGNESDATAYFGQGGLDVILNPSWYFPFSPNASKYAVPWATWYQNPKADSAIEPPSAARQQMQLYDQINGTPDPAKQADLMKQILDIAADEFYAIGITLWPNSFAVIKNDFHNVPKSLVHGGSYTNPAVTNPPQYFVER